MSNTSGVATVCRIEKITKHPNADRLALATILGTQVVVGLDLLQDIDPRHVR